MEAALRIWMLLVAAAMLPNSSCGSDVSRVPCAGESEQSTCPQSQSCVWRHLGASSAYVCATLCDAGGACPNGTSCRPDAASSCMTCENLLDVCE
jgi:hypothetical protein